MLLPKRPISELNENLQFSKVKCFVPMIVIEPAKKSIFLNVMFSEFLILTNLSLTLIRTFVELGVKLSLA